MSQTGGGQSNAGAGFRMEAGQPWPMGASLDGDGVNFVVFSAHAEKIEVCLFSQSGRREIARLALPDRDGDIWFGRVPGLGEGALYGLRATGPYAPELGQRFNPHKLLIDPYARQLSGSLRWSDALMGYRVGSPRADLSFDTRDSAFAVPKSRVTDPRFDWQGDAPPRVAAEERLIYEAHAKGLTMRHAEVPKPLRGTFGGLASAPIIAHLKALGITTLELLPVQSFLDDRFLVAQGARNYWGYQTLAFFAPEARYLARGAMAEFQTMVRDLHRAGIEVILDVVLNHTGEADEMGPTLSFRGLDNRSYYRLSGGGRHHINDTGTGNTLNLTHPMVLRMAMDSLRYWVEVGHVDGFRFDLATVLAREAGGFDANGGFLRAMRQDPVLSRVTLIAEPWDIGPGGYQLGRWPHPFLEWNDRFRDGVRRFWRGDSLMAADLARRLLGSAELFDHSGRHPSASVNFLTAHDGFTLADLVRYRVKHNEANGETNRDGHDENFSDNMGVEGETDDPALRARRAARVRAMLATLLLAQGTPMLLAGDEIGNGQGGNNNAYAQDNETGWINWPEADAALLDYVRRLVAIRRAHPALRQARFLHGRVRQQDGQRDLIWRRADGAEPSDRDWHDPGLKILCAEIRGAAEGPAGQAAGQAVFAVFNAGPETLVRLPETGRQWQVLLDSAHPEAAERDHPEPTARVAECSVLLFAQATV